MRSSDCEQVRADLELTDFDAMGRIEQLGYFDGEPVEDD
jgi:hypothetical protein